MRFLFRIYGYLQRIGQLLAQPIEWIWSLAIRFRRQLNRGLPRIRVSQWKWVRRARQTAYRLAASPSRILAKSAAQADGDDRASSAARKLLGLFFRASLLEPARWIVSIAGLLFRWVISRSWTSILVRGVPTCFLIILLFLVWQGGRMNKMQLAQRYLELGEAELVGWESNIDLSSGGNLLAADSAIMGGSLSGNPNGSPEIAAENAASETRGPSVSRVSSYGEMLFRRIHLLHPSDESRFVIGLTYLQHGAEGEAMKSLARLAPDGERGDPRVHGILAAMYLKRISETIDESLLPIFLHHATAGASWKRTPPEVLIAASEILWRTEKEDQAIALLQVAAENHPELFLLVYERAMAARLPAIADAARQKGITRFERLLGLNPKDDFSRVQLALLENTKLDGLPRAEQLLRQEPSSEQNPLLARALSEVYLKHFVQKSRAGTPQSLTLSFLDRAMAADSSNPSVADQIAVAINAALEQGQDLITELNRILVSGNATTGTHALFAEYYLSKDMQTQALIHLEQVFRVAPTAVKYANQLVMLYVSEGRMEDAFAVANRSLNWLERREMLGEKHVDELLENLGIIYEWKNEPQEAIPVYELSLVLNPARPETRRRLAALYRASGRESDALDQELLARTAAETNTKQKAFLDALEDPSSAILTKLRTSAERNPRSN